MTDGISITELTIGSAAFTTLGGLLGAWIKSRTPQKLEQPVRVEHERNQRDHENLFARVSALERASAASTAKLDIILDELKEIKRQLSK